MLRRYASKMLEPLRNTFIAPRTCTGATATPTPTEPDTQSKITEVLQQRLPGAEIVVEDISGGCGAMFQVWVESKDFTGLSRVKQHQIITNALKQEIQHMHGIRIHTSIPESSSSS